MKNYAHVFQHNLTGVQIFVYHVETEDLSRQKFAAVVHNTKDWDYIGKKFAMEI